MACPAPGGGRAVATLQRIRCARPKWRNGRRSGLKLRGAQARPSSNLGFGTNLGSTRRTSRWSVATHNAPRKPLLPKRVVARRGMARRRASAQCRPWEIRLPATPRQPSGCGGCLTADGTRAVAVRVASDGTPGPRQVGQAASVVAASASSPWANAPGPGRPSPGRPGRSVSARVAPARADRSGRTAPVGLPRWPLSELPVPRRTYSQSREAMTRGANPGRRGRAEPLARPTRNGTSGREAGCPCAALSHCHALASSPW
jgi:hypothetical protein